MYQEINAALQSFKVISEWVSANKGLVGHNEVVTAVNEVNAKLADMTAVALASQEKQSALSDRIRDLEQQLMEYEDFETESKRYILTELWSSGVVAYALKESLSNSEPPHYLCTNCYGQSVKSILQPQRFKNFMMLICPSCKTEFHSRHPKKLPINYAEYSVAQ